MSYSPTSPGGSCSPGPSILDDDSMAARRGLRDVVIAYQVEERKAARQQQQQMIQIVAALGGNTRAFRRERARKTRAVVAEFYSPPRALL